MRPTSTLRLLATASNKQKYPYRAPDFEVDHLVVGGGVVGLAVAARLTSSYPDKTTYLVERHAQVGQETSSRNSEVVHAGIYYPMDSWKTRLCVTGRQMIYDRCERLGIPYNKAGKLVVATSKKQIMYLDDLHHKTQDPYLSSFPVPTWPTLSGPPPTPLKNIGVPTYFMGGDEVREFQPDLGPIVLAAMFSPESGVVDTHALMESLETEVGSAESGNGNVVLGTKVVRIDPYRDDAGGKTSGAVKGWVVQTLTEGSSQPDALIAKVVVLAAGLNCVHLLNPLLPEKERLEAYYVKGNYLSYKGPGVKNISKLIYPCPAAGLAGLGTHLTLDMAGNVKFGPDVEVIEPEPGSDLEENPDFWEKHLAPSPHKIEEMAAAIHDYLPHIDPSALTPDYAGIRPNIAPAGAGFTDFHVSYDPASRPGLIGLCGFNSPGLTSSLSTAVEIEGLVRRDMWGKGSGKGKVRRVSEVGGETLDGWA